MEKAPSGFGVSVDSGTPSIVSTISLSCASSAAVIGRAGSLLDTAPFNDPKRV